MATNPDPRIDQWYEDLESGRSFCVVAVDERNDSIEVQYVDGDLGEYDFASWNEVAINAIDPPEDWSAPYGEVETDDLGYSDPDLHGSGRGGRTMDDLLDDEDRF